jgi:N-methylhydantoinase A
MDMGGTSCDVGSAVDGRFLLQSDREVEFQIPLRVPALDVVTIGAGGGSIARVDAGGALAVGPESAGASPGPACYGNGGTLPTVTDANVVLGRLRDGPIAGGAVEISSAAARDAVEQEVAAPLGLSVEAAALGILEIATAKMANAIREVSVSRGYDPRDFVLVAFGGAGPLHAGYVARELGVPRILVPKSPGILSAMGCMLSDVRFDYMKSILGTLDDATVNRMAEVVEDLRADGDSLLIEDGFAPPEKTFLYAADMRYLGQVHEVSVDLSSDTQEWSAETIAELFNRAHEAHYGTPFAGQEIEVVNVRVAAIGTTPKPTWTPTEAVTSRGGLEPIERRRVTFREGEFECPIFDRETLASGDVLEGPAVIESLDSTVVVLPNATATVDAYKALLIEQREAK